MSGKRYNKTMVSQNTIPDGANWNDVLTSFSVLAESDVWSISERARSKLLDLEMGAPRDPDAPLALEELREIREMYLDILREAEEI